MKTKILKKLIAVLCAATMSASVVAPAGAVKYSGGNPQSVTQKTNLDNLNRTIENSLNLLTQMDQKVSNKDSQNEMDKVTAKSLITNMHDNLKRLYGLSICSRTAIDNAYNSMSSFSSELYILLNLIDQKDINSINGSLTELDKTCTKILDDAKKFANNNNNNHNNNNNNNMINNNNFNNMGIMNNNMFVNNNNMNMMNNIINHNMNMVKMQKNMIKNALNVSNIIKNNNVFFKNQDIMVVNNIKNNIFNMRNRMLTKDIDPMKTNLQIKLTDKWVEFNQRLSDAYQFAKHRHLNDTYIRNIAQQCFTHYSNLDPMNKGADAINQAITLLDNGIKALDKFTIDNNMTMVIPETTSELKRNAETKYKEILRLIECAKKYNAFFMGNIWTKQACDFYTSIDFKNPNGLDAKLKQAIQYFDIAILSIQMFDDGMNKNELKEWQTEASKDIDMLLDQATKEMKNSPNKTSVQGITQEFTPLLCGVQRFGNCWLHAIRNVMNFGCHIQNQDQYIVKNTGVRDVNGFDNVERYFSQPQFGLSMNHLKSGGGNSIEESQILSLAGINHSMVSIFYEKTNVQNVETNIKLVKIMLLKHFAQSINPVLINFKHDEVAFDSNNGMGAGHAVVAVGLDIDTNSVVVADSNHQHLQVYSLDRIAHAICNFGMTEYVTKQISLIFPSFTNTGNFNYNNSYHSWSEFKSQLLPAISKQF